MRRALFVLILIGASAMVVPTVLAADKKTAPDKPAAQAASAPAAAPQSMGEAWEAYKPSALEIKLVEIFKRSGKAMTEKKWDEAIKIYDEGIMLAPTRAGFWYGKAQAMISRGLEKLSDKSLKADEASRAPGKKDLVDGLAEMKKAERVYLTTEKDLSAGQRYNSRRPLYSALSSAYYYAAVLAGETEVAEGHAAFMSYLSTLYQDKQNREEAVLVEDRMLEFLYVSHQHGPLLVEANKFLGDDADRLTALAYSGMVLAASGQMDTGSIGAGRERLERFLKLAPKDHILRKQVEQALSASAPKKV